MTQMSKTGHKLYTLQSAVKKRFQLTTRASRLKQLHCVLWPLDLISQIYAIHKYSKATV